MADHDLNDVALPMSERPTIPAPVPEELAEDERDILMLLDKTLAAYCECLPSAEPSRRRIGEVSRYIDLED